jgi:tetratricopeptide (TPR) repeat protein
MKNALKILFLVLLLLPAAASAEIKEIIAEGTYNMGDGETPGVAESRALLNAKRVAIEQAGTYVESYSKVKNLQLTEDEIKVMASGVMEVTIIGKKRTVVGEGLHFWVKIKALVNSDKMDSMAGKAKDKSVVEEYRKIQAAYDSSLKDIEVLKKQLVAAKGDQKKEVERKIVVEEKRFQATEWIEKGQRATNAFSERNDYLKAIEAFTSAIALDPTRCDAYTERSIDYQRIGELEKAKEDLDKSLTLPCSNEFQEDRYFYGYYAIGKSYFDKQKYFDAIDPFTKAEKFYGGFGVYQKLDPLYFWRGVSYLRLRQFDKAIKDLNKALTVDPDNSSGNNQYVYDNRGLALYNYGDKRAGIADFRKACELGLDNACQRVKQLVR